METTTARPSPRCLRLLGWLLLTPACLAAPLHSSEETPQPPAPPASVWTSTRATHLLGLPEVKPRLPGTLVLSPAGLSFTSPAGEASIDRARILSVAIGDERQERGGKLGKFARSAIPYGGGAALAAVSGGQVDLLTLEFRDERGAYHGAVFSLPRQEAAHAQQYFAFTPPPAVLPAPPSCPAGAGKSSTVRLDPIAMRGDPIPLEYKVLLYENLLRHLREQKGLQAVYREGDNSPAAACPELTLSLTATAFDKGNAVLRASTGPLGMFWGATRLSFDMHLRDDQGNVLLDKPLKASQRGDKESLDIADEVAKSVAKKLKKINTQRHD